MYSPDKIWEFDMADRIKFGLGASKELEEEILRRKSSSILITTDKGVEKAGIVEEITQNLADDLEYEIFSKVEPDPSIPVFENAVSLGREVNADLIVGVGGGSSMDVAKTTGVVCKHGGEILDYIARPTGEGKPVPGESLPTICIPTTSGTGSETSPVSVISVPAKKIKVGISSRYQYPNLALVDPLLTLSMPRKTTASSGMDAISHAIEAYTTRKFDWKPHPKTSQDRPDYSGRSILTDQLSFKAIELVTQNLRRAVNNGNDLDARRNMSLASLLAGMAFTNAGLGAVHAIALAIAGEYSTPHGETVATVLPEVMRFNATSSFDRFVKIAKALGENVEEDSVDEAAKKAAIGIRKLASDTDIPESLSELGVTEEETTKLAERTMKIQRLLVGNPRYIDEEDIKRIINRSL